MNASKKRDLLFVLVLSATATSSHAGGFLADLGQSLGIISPGQAEQLDKSWAGIKGAVPGLGAVEDSISATARGAANAGAAYYGGPLAPAIGNAIIDQQRRRLDNERRAARQQGPVGNAPAPRVGPPMPSPQYGYGAGRRSERVRGPRTHEWHRSHPSFEPRWWSRGYRYEGPNDFRPTGRPFMQLR